ncbi:MAG TPA: hypothetical protein VMU86_00955, partial [Steroidobacteraceae bacterium]|nr:hypothetical protein [Steroidobacteraceae bacterium]
MSARPALLAERREALLARSEALRESLCRDGEILAQSVRVVDRLIARANSRFGRIALLGAAALLLLRRPRRLLRIALRIAPFVPAVRSLLRRWFAARRGATASAEVSPPR